MKTAHHKPRISLFAKFAIVMILLGVMPVASLAIVLQSRMLTEYRTSLETTYKDALAYSAYSVEARLDDYSDLTKFCYYYSYSSEGNFAYDYDNYDNVHKILEGTYFEGEDDVEDRIRTEMEQFLNYLNKTNASIEASHFIYAPEGQTPVSYHEGNYTNASFVDDVYLDVVSFDTIDKDSRNMLIVPTHPLNYIRYPSTHTGNVLTVGRNYYDLTGVVGQERYLGTLLIDLRLDDFEDVFDRLNLTEGSTVYVTDAAGRIYFASDWSLVGQEMDETEASDADHMLLSEEISGYGLTVWCRLSHSPIERQIQAMRRLIQLAVVLSLVVLFIGATFFSRKLTQPLRDIMQSMAAVESGDFTNRLPVTSNDELGDLTERFNEMNAELDTYTKQVYLSRIRQTEAELNALKSQIYPHFLYNTLEIIRMTAVSREDAMVAEMIEALSDQIRYVIGTVNDLVPLHCEVENLTKYIYLLNCRFDNKVSFSYDLGALSDSLVTKLVLQPIVENAFIHGIKPKEGPGHIRLTAERDGGSMILTVMDNGVGMTAEDVQELYDLLASDQPGRKREYEWGSIGLKNVHDRLRYLYGENYGVTLFSTLGVGTVVKVTVPADLQDDNSGREVTDAENADRG